MRSLVVLQSLNLRPAHAPTGRMYVTLFISLSRKPRRTTCTTNPTCHDLVSDHADLIRTCQKPAFPALCPSAGLASVAHVIDSPYPPNNSVRQPALSTPGASSPLPPNGPARLPAQVPPPPLPSIARAWANSGVPANFLPTTPPDVAARVQVRAWMKSVLGHETTAAWGVMGVRQTASCLRK